MKREILADEIADDMAVKCDSEAARQRETVADIVAEKRTRANEIERDVAAKMKSGEMVSDQYAREVVADLRKEADRLEAAARRAYNEIDRAVRETGRVNAEGVELIRTAMNNTIGEYCE